MIPEDCHTYGSAYYLQIHAPVVSHHIFGWAGSYTYGVADTFTCPSGWFSTVVLPRTQK